MPEVGIVSERALVQATRESFHRRFWDKRDGDLLLPTLGVSGCLWWFCVSGP